MLKVTIIHKAEKQEFYNCTLRNEPFTGDAWTSLGRRNRFCRWELEREGPGICREKRETVQGETTETGEH